MKHFALGWACNLNDIFIRFPYEKCKSLVNIKSKHLKRQKIKKVFREGVEMIINDIVENNASFLIPTFKNYDGEIHFEPIRDSEFKRLRAKGKFSGIDFLETLFTGYQLYLYIHRKSDKFSNIKKIPIYMSSHYKRKMENLANLGKVYC